MRWSVIGQAVRHRQQLIEWIERQRNKLQQREYYTNIIMKAYRQSARKHQTHTRTHPRPTHTLRSLLNQHPHHTLTLNCQTAINVTITAKHYPVVTEFKGQQPNHQPIYVQAGSGISNLLLQCMQSYEEKGGRFIFTAQPQRKKQPIANRSAKSQSTHVNLASNAPVGPFYTHKKTQSDRQGYIPFSSTNNLKNDVQNQKQIHRYFSHKRIEAPMFTVQEIGESMQSQAKESMKLEKKGIKFTEGSTAKDYLAQLMSPQSGLQSIGHYKVTQEDKENQNDNQRTMCPPVVKTDPIESGDLIVARKSLIDKTRDEGSDHRFSFASNMRKGLIEKNRTNDDEASRDNWLSFKIATDAQIENQKLKSRQGAEIHAQDMSSLSEISSIISTQIREDKKEAQDQLDSIKHELENISNCCPSFHKKENMELKEVDRQKPGEMVGKVQPHKKGEAISDKAAEEIEIIEQKNEENKSEFTVKYNFRFLQKKGQTEVVRISPLRFRKKEEVVQHLVKAQIVKCESSSINIP